MRFWTRFVRQEDGAAMVEFALVTSLIFVPLVFGIIEFGRLNWAKTMITNAAKEGARYAAVHGAESGAVADSAAVANYVIGRTQLSPLVVRSSWAQSKDPGDTVTVQVEYTYTPIVRVIASKTIISRSRNVVQY